jgi:hypothetical protein
MRVLKSEAEQDIMRASGKISGEAFAKVNKERRESKKVF